MLIASAPPADVSRHPGNGLAAFSCGAIAQRLAAGERVRSSHDDLASTWADFLAKFDMQWFCTFTFRQAVHPEAANKKFRLWISTLNGRVYGRNWRKDAFKQVFWIRALEYQKRNVLHYHALVGDSKDLNENARRLTFMDEWHRLAGIARIEPIESEAAVRAYCAKYTAKGGEIDLSPSLRWYLQPMREHVLG